MDNTRALTGVRFVFAAMVVLFHLASQGKWLDQAGINQGPTWVANLIGAGHAGVQFFFVLSGFILALTYHDLTRERDRAFYAARVARIYPIYLLGLLVMLPATWLTTFHIDAGGLPPMLALVVQVILGLLLLQAWFPRWALSGNGPGWSLSAEAFFYACFPRLMRWLRTWTTSGLIIGIVLLVLTQQVVCGLGWHWSGLALWRHEAAFGSDAAWWADFWRFNPLLHLPEFISGMVAYLLLRRQAVPSSVLRWSAAIGALTIIGVMMTGVLPYILLNNGGLILPCVLLIWGLTQDSWFSRLLGSAPMQVLGQASYALYLLHVPVMWYLERLDARVLHLGEQHPLVLTAIYLVLVVPLSIAAFFWIEEPLRRRIRARLAG